MAENWVEELLDPGSFAGTAVDGRGGHGSVDGRPVCVFDGLGPAAVAALDLALKVGCPVVGSAGGDPGDADTAAVGELLSRGVLASGVVPQVALVLGPCEGGPALVPALADFVVMVEGDGRLLLGDTEAIATVTGELVDAEELAGTRAHAARTGTAHFRAADRTEAVELARTLLGYLPGNNLEEPPALEAAADPSVVTARDLELDGLLPEAPELPFDVRRLVERVVDDGELLEVQALFAGNLLCGLGRVDGRPVGVVASQAAGPAAEVLGGRRLRADLVLAWPDAEVAGLGPEEAAARGWLHDVVRPSQTRPRVSAALRLLRGKREPLPPKRHGNMPL